MRSVRFRSTARPAGHQADSPRIFRPRCTSLPCCTRELPSPSQYKSHQWLQGKAWDASTPVGPDLVTLDEAPDPLTLRTFVNGEKVQEASTELLIFDVATLVSVVSEFATLEPGDLILTGTPGGVGYRREPQLLLKEGDVVVVEVDGVGRIENRCVAEQA